MDTSKRSITIHIPITLRRIQFSIYQSYLPCFRQRNLHFGWRSHINLPIFQANNHQYDQEKRSNSKHSWNQCNNPSRRSYTVRLYVTENSVKEDSAASSFAKISIALCGHPFFKFVYRIIILYWIIIQTRFVLIYFCLCNFALLFIYDMRIFIFEEQQFNIAVLVMINIFQYLKQGTSLSRNSHNSNQQLQEHIIAKTRTENHTYEQTGKFHQSDSEDDPHPDTFDQKELESYRQKIHRENNQFIKRHHIKVQGIDVPLAMTNFTKIILKYQLNGSLIKGIGQLGFQRPTAVQMQVIPCLLERRNMIVTAPTGTGKTLSFILPLLQNLKPTKKIGAIIMVPLQELATQILQVLTKLAVGSAITYQCCSKLTQGEIEKIQNKKSPGFNILIATPLTFLKYFQDKKMLLKHVQYIILDQCDKCFQESFFEQMKRFLDLFVKYHPTYALFSATIQNSVQEILKIYLDDCIRIEVGGKNKVLDKISQTIEYCTNQLGKLVFLKNLITEGKLVPPVLIFVQQKQRAKQLYYEINKYLRQQLKQGKRVQALSSDKSKQQRQKIISQFDAGKYWILITTDLLARGIDFKNVNIVINYDFPNSMLTYIHRVGRTGRAQRSGAAITFFTDQDKPLVRSLANLLKISGCRIPQWIAQMPKAKKQLIKKLQKFPVRRLPVGRADGKDKQWGQQLQVLEKRWQKLKRKQIERGQKQQKQKQDDDGWIQVEQQEQ